MRLASLVYDETRVGAMVKKKTCIKTNLLSFSTTWLIECTARKVKRCFGILSCIMDVLNWFSSPNRTLCFYLSFLSKLRRLACWLLKQEWGLGFKCSDFLKALASPLAQSQFPCVKS